LYECVQTIMAVESEDSLRVLAVNILGRFLLNRDNNIRYVALNTLSRCIAEEQQSGRDEIVANAGDNANNASSALQRHRTTIVDCLKDPDVSIRQRALELIYHLVNADNVESLTAELLNYLVLCPREHRADICTRVLRVVDRFSPDDRWRVDTLITMLTIAGRESTRDVLSATSIYISRASPDIQAYATHRLLKAIRDDDGSQRGLLSVGIWCIGEFGDYLLQPYSYDASSGSNSLTSNGGAASSGPTKVSFMALDATTVVSTVDDVIKRHSCPEDVKQRAITCFAKLSERFSDKGDQAALEQLHNLVKKHETSFSLELQLRSCEYDALLNAVKGIKTSVKPVSDDFFAVTNGDSGVSTKVSSAAKEALARMPVVDLKVMQRRQASDEGGEDGEPNARAPVASKAKAGGDLLDLDDIFGGTTTSVPATQIIANKSSNGVAAKSDLDLLSDIFSAPMPATPAVPVPSMGYDPFSALPAQPAPIPAVNPLDLFGAPPAPVSMAPTSSPIDLFGSTTLSQPAVSSTPVVSTTQPLSGVSEPASGSVMIPGFSHGGLTVEFECTKPDVWNKQKSTLVALFKNTTDAPLYGVNLQCAVPKYVTMEMQPPDSTTVPVTVGNSAKLVTQKINVTNSMLGTKSLMLKLKVGFTSKGTKIEHLATCSGFPAGQY
jgi:AP-1 complex subunit gamma-1